MDEWLTMRSSFIRHQFTDNGFALVEVLVGLAILSIAMISATRAIGGAADTQRAISERTMALWSADNALLDLRMARAWPALGTTSSQCPQDNYLFICQRKVMATPNPGFRRVEMGVYLRGSDDGGSSYASSPRLAWLITILPNPDDGIL
jgi:general secretion pathway protein I